MAGITRRRRGELVRKVFEILHDTDGMPAQEVLARAAQELELTDFEKSEYPDRPGVRRFEKAVRFATIGPVKAGWLIKEGGTWTLTDTGRDAWTNLEDPENFMKEAGRLYREWKAAHPTEREEEDEDVALAEDLELYGGDAEEMVERIRTQHIPSERIDYRQQAETRAKDFLDQHAGRMTTEQAFELGRLFNADLRGKERHDRFKPAFHGATMQRIVEDIDAFNEWTRQLCDSDEEKALVALDEIVSDKTAFPGAGRSYPTLLMYLRDPKRFAVWLPATIKGLRALTGYRSGSRAEGQVAYLRFCEAVADLMNEYGLEPQEVDIVLTVAGRLARQVRGETFLPLSEAPGFLADLKTNNTQAWFSQNRDRYERELFEPFRRLMEAVAHKHLRDLDPNLVTEVKTGKVLAKLPKRWPNDSGDYNEYFWGAFSRGKKQEDVQLFFIVYPDRLRYGLYLGSAQPEQREQLTSAVRSEHQRFLELLAPIRERLVFYLDDERRSPINPLTQEELLEWLDGAAPSVAEELAAEDSMLGSSRLIERVGSLLATLHPLAAAAWGEGLRRKPDEEEEAEPEERHTLERLVADTLLPIDDLEEWSELLQQEGKRQAIFYGSPGTGKTHVARSLAQYLSNDGGDFRVVQFHPAFSYEDFLEGLRPFSKPHGTIGYEIRPGVFLDFCEQARGAEGTFVFVIDEINRAEIAAVLGELMMLLEYRGETLQLPYSKKRFSVPRNVVVLATMNTADRSLALVDFALRRRFHAIELPPSREILTAYLSARGEDPELPLMFFDLVQSRVADAQFAPGHTFWMSEDLTPAGLDRIWRFQIKPYLREFWFENQPALRDLENEVELLLAEGD